MFLQRASRKDQLALSQISQDCICDELSVSQIKLKFGSLKAFLADPRSGVSEAAHK